MAYEDILNNLKETPPPMRSDRVLVVDGLNTLIRSFTLIKAMNSQGHHVGGLVGFLRSLGYLVRTQDPTRVIIVWDGKGGSMARKNIDSNYKANREGVRITNWEMFDSKLEESESLTAQLDRLLDYLQCLPVQNLMLEKLEADDVIAYLAKQTPNSNIKEFTIVSSDKDFLQLIDEKVKVWSPVKKVMYSKKNVSHTIGCLPENYNIVKALLGDNSDNLPGVKGVGLKTVLKEFPLLKEEATNLEYIYDTCGEKLGGKKVFQNIIHNWDKVERNFKLMDLHDSMLDQKEKDHILEVLKQPTPELSTGVFFRLMDIDKIEGITKNTDTWIENFRDLTKYE